MQRRAVAAYATFFFVLTIGAYLVAGTQYAAANNARASLWGIVILSGLTGIFMIGMAYLPIRG
jgi:hypothetical protein